MVLDSEPWHYGLNGPIRLLDYLVILIAFLIAALRLSS